MIENFQYSSIDHANPVLYFTYASLRVWAWDHSITTHGASFRCKVEENTGEKHSFSVENLNGAFRNQFKDSIAVFDAGEAFFYYLETSLVSMGLFPEAPKHLCLSSMARDLPGFHQEEKHPVTGEVEELANIIIDLNDDHDWTREAIADWIETLDDVPVFSGEQVEQKEVRDLVFKVIEGV